MDCFALFADDATAKKKKKKGVSSLCFRLRYIDFLVVDSNEIFDFLFI